MHIKTISAGPIETNAFVVGDEASHEAIIIDAPPESADRLLDAVRDDGYRVQLIVLTHAHFDHVIDAARIKQETGAPLAIHEDAMTQLRQVIQGGQAPYTVEDIGPDQYLNEGDEIAVGTLRFSILVTPGHAPGQVSLYEETEQVLFGGDTLFPGGYGRADLPGSSMEETRQSIRKLMELPDGVTVYPGHGLPAQIGNERSWMKDVADGKEL
ncbi:MAG: MBL fold metallo-hydrolase [Sphaerobacteraceae bacterium]|nr:MAG: MBL fold metallo-hydrolase [Sphaerobacteraceae bacterium]